MLKLTKKNRRGLLDRGVTRLVDLDMYGYLSCRATRDNNVVKVNFSEYYKDLKKGCGKFSVSERNIYRIFYRLVDHGLIKIQMQGFGEALVEVYFLDELFCPHQDQMTKPSKDLNNENLKKQDNKSDAGIESQKTGIDQQQLIYVDQKCRSVGMIFNKKDLWKIAKYPRELINIAVQYYRFAQDRNHIPSPTGWLICCLRDKWYLNFKPEKFVPSAEQKLFELQDWFLENFGSVPRREDFQRKIPIPSQ